MNLITAQQNGNNRTNYDQLQTQESVVATAITGEHIFFKVAIACLSKDLRNNCLIFRFLCTVKVLFAKEIVYSNEMDVRNGCREEETETKRSLRPGRAEREQESHKRDEYNERVAGTSANTQMSQGRMVV